MPVLPLDFERFARERPLEGVTVGACLHITSETACLVRALQAGGADVALCASNPFATQQDVAAVSPRSEVHAGCRTSGPRASPRWSSARRGPHGRRRRPDGRAARGPSRPAGRDARRHRGDLRRWLRLPALEADGRLMVPVIAVNEARAERAFNDRFGTGQSVLDGILRATNLLLGGQTVVVLGYGWTGRGVALRAQGLGASVIVCEVDPFRALEARMEGSPSCRRWPPRSVAMSSSRSPAARTCCAASTSRDEGRRRARQRRSLRRRDSLPNCGRRRSTCARCCHWSSATTSATGR